MSFKNVCLYSSCEYLGHITKKALPVLIPLLLTFAVLPKPVLAHDPTAMKLEYDLDNQTLSVTITHLVADPNSHYIYKVEIRKNGAPYLTEEYISQPTTSTFTYTYSVTAIDGDVLKVTADCSIGGSITGTLDVSAGYFEIQVIALWPYHAALMAIGFILMATGMVNARYVKPKRWWLKAHRIIGILGAIFALSGLSMAIYMVSSSTGVHFRVPHAYLGAITIIFVVMTSILGYAQLKSVSKGAKIRNIHRWSGGVTLVLMLINIILGLLLVA